MTSSLPQRLARWLSGPHRGTDPAPAKPNAEDYLRAQQRDGTYPFIHINKCGGTSVEQALGLPKIHDTAMMRRDRLGAEVWNRLATFSIVRHPYAKVSSHYRYRVKKNKTGLGDGRLDLNAWVLETYRDRNPAYYNNPLMFAPCLTWLTDEAGDIMVDHVARLETIDTDWPEIQRLIGVEAALPQVNKPPSARGEPLSPEAREAIRRAFALDFEAFGYDPD